MLTLQKIYILMGILISLGAVSPVITVPNQPINRIVSLNYFKQIASYHLDKTSIGGVNLDMDPEQVIKILGQPKTISEKWVAS